MSTKETKGVPPLTPKSTKICKLGSPSQKVDLGNSNVDHDRGHYGKDVSYPKDDDIMKGF